MLENRRARLTADDSEEFNGTLERRRRAFGGVLELARALDAWRLMRALEVHADALTRPIQVLVEPQGALTRASGASSILDEPGR